MPKMKTFNRIFISLLLTVFLAGNAPVSANAALGSVLPMNTKPCDEVITAQEGAFKDPIKFKEAMKTAERTNVLACAVKTGRIHLYMMPFFVTSLIQFLISIAGLIAILFMVYGGFKYAVGGLSEDKEGGKKVVLHALLGLVVALAAWIIVSVVQLALTGSLSGT